MGVYIKGMEMPRNCAACCLDRFCKHWDIRSDRHEDCPLVPVPPHGRCIDADALKAEGWELQMFRHDEYGCSITCRSLDSEDIPTIIPAEEGE